MRLNSPHTEAASCSAGSSHPAARTASASAAVIRLGVPVSLPTYRSTGLIRASTGAAATSSSSAATSPASTPNACAVAVCTPWQ
jgi:hypothetical protein